MRRLLKRFLNLDRCIIAFLKFIFMKVLLCISIVTLIGACFFRTLQKAVSNSLYVESFSFPNSLFNAIMGKKNSPEWGWAPGAPREVNSGTLVGERRRSLENFYNAFRNSNSPCFSHNIHINPFHPDSGRRGKLKFLFSHFFVVPPKVF